MAVTSQADSHWEIPTHQGISSRMVFVTLMAYITWVATSSSVSVHGVFPAASGTMLGFCGLNGAVALGISGKGFANRTSPSILGHCKFKQ
eukprot:8485278-Ditylum_brightwellii.AAC.1